ncbi:unnamed protein product, partial [Phaeothamnion confervicola]
VRNGLKSASDSRRRRGGPLYLLTDEGRHVILRMEPYDVSAARLLPVGGPFSFAGVERKRERVMEAVKAGSCAQCTREYIRAHAIVEVFLDCAHFGGSCFLKLAGLLQSECACGIFRNNGRNRCSSSDK